MDSLERPLSSGASRALRPSTYKKEELVSTEDSGHRAELLGNNSTVERPLHKESATPRRPRREQGALPVRVTFEAHRLAATYLATAYEQVMPLGRRGIRAGTAATPAPADHRPGERVGA
jgi:hypothetical protein